MIEEDKKMRNLRDIIIILAIVTVFLFTGNQYLYAGAGIPNIWGENSSASGTRALGPLTIYGQDTDAVCDGSFAGDQKVLMYFFLRVKIGNAYSIYSGVSDETYCHPGEFGEGETVALHEFLKDVLIQLRPTGGYEDCVVDPFGTSGAGNVCPNILRSLDNAHDTSDQPGRPLSQIADVELRIP
jgi:hypothetical protein